jgi:hypothetical protein
MTLGFDDKLEHHDSNTLTLKWHQRESDFCVIGLLVEWYLFAID